MEQTEVLRSVPKNGFMNNEGNMQPEEEENKAAETMENEELDPYNQKEPDSAEKINFNTIEDEEGANLKASKTSLAELGIHDENEDNDAEEIPGKRKQSSGRWKQVISSHWIIM